MTGNPDDHVRVLPVVREALDEEAQADLLRRCLDARQHFPALDGEVVTLARLKPDSEYVRDPVAAADPYNRLVYVPTHERVSDMTLFHELAHLAIKCREEAGEDVPTTSEKYCSIYAVSRMPPERVDRDYIAYLGRPSAPREEWPAICQRGLEYREDNHAYVQQTKEWLGA